AGIRPAAPVIEGTVRSAPSNDQPKGAVLRLLGVDPFSEVAFRLAVDSAPRLPRLCFSSALRRPAADDCAGGRPRPEERIRERGARRPADLRRFDRAGGPGTARA